MKHSYIYIFSLLSIISLYQPTVLCNNQAQADCAFQLSSESIGYKKMGGLNQRTKEILLHIGKVISNLFNLLLDRKNPQHVGACVEEMLTEIVNISVTAVQNRTIRIEDGIVTLTESDIQALLIVIEEALARLQQESDYITPDLGFISSKLNTVE